MKTNLTLRVEGEVVRAAKVLAARRGLSISRLLSDQLEELIRRETAYETARQRAEERLAHGYDLEWQRPSSRDELHERTLLR
jgi:hypothetical protein